MFQGSRGSWVLEVPEVPGFQRSQRFRGSMVAEVPEVPGFLDSSGSRVP